MDWTILKRFIDISVVIELFGEAVNCRTVDIWLVLMLTWRLQLSNASALLPPWVLTLLSFSILDHLLVSSLVQLPRASWLEGIHIRLAFELINMQCVNILGLAHLRSIRCGD